LIDPPPSLPESRRVPLSRPEPLLTSLSPPSSEDDAPFESSPPPKMEHAESDTNAATAPKHTTRDRRDDPCMMLADTSRDRKSPSSNVVATSGARLGRTSSTAIHPQK
jgi:hypothetical protein